MQLSISAFDDNIPLKEGEGHQKGMHNILIKFNKYLTTMQSLTLMAIHNYRENCNVKNVCTPGQKAGLTLIIT